MITKKDIENLKDRIVVPGGLVHNNCLKVVRGSPSDFINKLNELMIKK